MRTKGYGSYHGRSRFKRFLKTLAIVLLILIVLGVALAVYLQRFLVISHDGVRLEIPFFQREEQPGQTQDPALPPVVTPEPPLEIVTPEPPPEPRALHPVALPEAALYDGTAVEQIQGAGGDCALFDMKTNSGRLAYSTQLELAVQANLTVESPAINAAAKALNATEGLYTVARVSCFKDHDTSNVNRALCVTTNSGYRWTDPEGIRWISPTNPTVRDYLTQICVELAELGFDEILLDNAGYPNQGNLHYIKKGAAYDAAQFSTVIDGFYAQVADALAGYDVKLSVVTTAEAMAGMDSLTGQTPENLARADRLWLVDETGALAPTEMTLSTDVTPPAEENG